MGMQTICRGTRRGGIARTIRGAQQRSRDFAKAEAAAASRIGRESLAAHAASNAAAAAAELAKARREHDAENRRCHAEARVEEDRFHVTDDAASAWSTAGDLRRKVACRDEHAALVRVCGCEWGAVTVAVKEVIPCAEREVKSRTSTPVRPLPPLHWQYSHRRGWRLAIAPFG